MAVVKGVAASTTSKVLSDAECRALLSLLWGSLQGVSQCLDTWDEDVEWANGHPHSAYPGKKAEGLGRRFALQQFRSRVTFEDVDSLVEAIHMLRVTKKIAFPDQADKRGFVEISDV